MTDREGLSSSAKLLTAAAVSLLLSFGLCGMGWDDPDGTRQSNAEATAGVLLLGLAVVLGIAGWIASTSPNRDQ